MQVKYSVLISPLLAVLKGAVQRCLYHRPDKPGQHVDRLRIPALALAEQDPAAMAVLEGLPRERRMSMVEKAIFKFVRELDGQFKMRDGLLQSNPVSLEGMWYPEVSRRDDVEIPPLYLQAAQGATDVCYTMPEPYAEMILDAVMSSEMFTADGYLDSWFERLEDEVHRHGFGVDTYIPFRIFDWRGRAYADTGGILNYQADKLSRSLLWFREALPVPDPENTLFPLLRDGYGVTPGNYEQILSAPSESVDRFGDLGRTLAGACAMDEFVRTGSSSFCCHMDQTCSGGAWIAFLERSQRLARNSNLLGGDRRCVYRNHARKVMLRDRVLKALGSAGLTVVRNEVSKPTCVPGLYGVGHNALIYNFLNAGNRHMDLEMLEPEDLLDLTNKISIAECLQPHFTGCTTYKDHHRVMKHLVRRFVREFRKEVPEQGRVDRRHRIMQNAAIAKGTLLGYTTPLGWHVQPSHWRRDIEHTHRVRDNSAVLGEDDVTVSNCDWLAVPEAVTYFPHGLDAAANIGVLLRLQQQGIQCGSTHDDWHVHACNLQYLPRVVRDVTVRVMSTFEPQYHALCEEFGLYADSEGRKTRVTLPKGESIISHIPEDAQFVVV